MLDRFRFRLTPVVLLGSVLALGACNRKKDTTTASASASVAASASAEPRSPELMSAYRRQLTPPPVVPVGPPLALVPGKGAGSIFFGATVETIERHMQAPCTVKTETRCRYPAHAIDFYLEDGVLVRIHAHRRDRPADENGEGKIKFGAFNGIIPPDPANGRPEGVAFGMHAEGVAEGMPAPKRVEPVKAANPNNTVELHHYDGVLLEYDTHALSKDGRPILGGIIILPDAESKATIAREKAKLAEKSE